VGRRNGGTGLRPPPARGGGGVFLSLLLLLPLLLAAAAPPSKESTTRQQLDAAERARAAELAAQKAAADRAAAAAAESQRLAAARDAALARLHDAEAATTQAAERVDALEARRKAAAGRLEQRAAAMRPLLPLIERLSLYPAETLLAVPAPVEDRLRGLVVLQGLTQQLQDEAAALRRDRAALDDASKAVAAELPRLQAARADQAQAAAALDAQLAQSEAARQQAEAEAEAAAKRAAEQAAKAETLRGVLATLEAQRRAEEARAREEAARAARQKQTAEAEAARQREAALAHPTGPGTLAGAAHPGGQLLAPVAGTVVRTWGEPTEAGPATGISYQAAPAARVVSPCSGRVAFADHFRSYGLLLIVDCGGGYHAVLAGFDRLDTQAGQALQAGQPVGVMPNWEPGGQRPALYVELRHDGQPVNPAPWLKAHG
jgi:septal ring factor EnvC (AmiA/AmiB activator)